MYNRYNNYRYRQGATAKFDKQIISVLKTTVGGTKVQTDLYSANRAVTIIGLRWNLCFTQDGTGGGNNIAYGKWVIVHVQEGDTTHDPDLGDENTSYNPEQSVMAFGDWAIDNKTQTKILIDESTAKRKLKVGDTLHFVALGVNTNTTHINGTIQFFTKE